MNGKFTKAAAIVLTVSALLGAAWAFDKRYTPREITEMEIAQLQNNQMQIQRNIQIQNAQQWLWFWQMKVEEFTAICSRDPNNQNARIRLNEAKAKRDYWQGQVNRLMNN